MKKIPIILLFVLSVSTLLVTSFQMDDAEKASLEKDPQVLAALDERLGEYRRIRNQNCQKEVLKKANEIVDSILLEISRRNKLDSLIRPMRPNKPGRPNIVAPKDTGAIEPLWKTDSLQLDSLAMVMDSLQMDSLQLDSLLPYR
ncbi:MAG: hypothetical protein AAFO94_04300 [Bacteroidota bacterium]